MARLVFQLEQVGTVILRISNFCKLKRKLTIYFFEVAPRCIMLSGRLDLKRLLQKVRLSIDSFILNIVSVLVMRNTRTSIRSRVPGLPGHQTQYFGLPL